MPEAEAFLGAWRLTREIDDSRAGQVVQFSGWAEVTGASGAFTYSERGLLHIPGQRPVTAERCYLWRADVGGIDVRFEDGRFFHTIAPGAQPEALHDCPPDLYRVCYDFMRWPRWSSTWHVTGPRKDYTMRSAYSRVG